MFKWVAGVPGKKGTDWEGGTYKVVMEFPEDYPSRPPKCKLGNEIAFICCHCYCWYDVCVGMEIIFVCVINLKSHQLFHTMSLGNHFVHPSYNSCFHGIMITIYDDDD